MANGTETYTYTFTQSPFTPPPNPSPGYVSRSDQPGSYISCILSNDAYQDFLTWIAAGNPAPSGWTGPKNP